jgi:formylmethanofuran dehydrogenase subunit E
MRWAALLVVLAAAAPAGAQSPEDWIRLGESVHGGFGTLIPLGIRIGLDARERLGAAPRELDVTYYDGEGTPCPCVVDGILIATRASPGQGTLRVAAEKAPAGFKGEALIRHRKTGKALRYRIPAAAYGEVLSWNKGRTPRERYDAVMRAAASSLFIVEP